MGDDLRLDVLGQEQTFVIRGLIYDAEHVITAKDVTPEPAKYGYAVICWNAVPQLPLNEAVARLEAGADRDQVERALAGPAAPGADPDPANPCQHPADPGRRGHFPEPDAGVPHTGLSGGFHGGAHHAHTHDRESAHPNGYAQGPGLPGRPDQAALSVLCPGALQRGRAAGHPGGTLYPAGYAVCHGNRALLSASEAARAGLAPCMGHDAAHGAAEHGHLHARV